MENYKTNLEKIVYQYQLDNHDQISYKIAILSYYINRF